MRTPQTLALVAVSLCWSACNASRPIITVNDDADIGPCDGASVIVCADATLVCNQADCPGGHGGAGGAGNTAGTGGSGGGAIPCDGGAVFICSDATKVCNRALCPGGEGGIGGVGNMGGRGGSSGAAGTGTAGGGQVGVGTLIACPDTPPTGACSVEFMNCEYPDSNSSCRCTSGAWSCSACPATAGATTGGAVCRYGSLTCSQFGCGVCPDAHPTAGAACGNSRFKCEYGGDVCLCGGNDGWKCTTLSCPQSPTSDHRPSCASLSLSDGSNITFNFACSYTAEKQSCACNDSTGYGTYYCGCPAALPAEGSACIGPSPCSYGGVTCNCASGHWNCGGGACPTTKPTAGGACAAQVSCSYNNASGGQDFCACDGTAWSCP